MLEGSVLKQCLNLKIFFISEANIIHMHSLIDKSNKQLSKHYMYTFHNMVLCNVRVIAKVKHKTCIIHITACSIVLCVNKLLEVAVTYQTYHFSVLNWHLLFLEVTFINLYFLFTA